METILEQLDVDNIPVEKQIDLLAEFLMEEFPKEMGNNGKGEGAIGMAVRLLEEYKKNMNRTKKCISLSLAQKISEVAKSKGKLKIMYAVRLKDKAGENIQLFHTRKLAEDFLDQIK